MTTTTPTTQPTTQPTATPARVRITFDMLSCGRCGGTGRYGSYGVCYACGGAKGKLSRSGMAARKKYDAWRDATLSLPIDATLVGQRAFIPRQFVGPQNGGTWITFKREYTVVAVGEPDAHGCVRVSFKCPMTSADAWLQYDEATKVLTVQTFPTSDKTYDSRLYRAPTHAELVAIAPTLGAGATLVEIPQ